MSTFAMDAMAKQRFEHVIAKEEAIARGEEPPEKDKGGGGLTALAGEAAAMGIIPIIEVCRYCPGLVTAMGVSMGLTSAAIMGKGTIEQKKRWALDLLTFDKVGAGDNRAGVGLRRVRCHEGQRPP